MHRGLDNVMLEAPGRELPPVVVSREVVDGDLGKVEVVRQLVLREEAAGIFRGCQMKAVAFGVDVPSLVRSLAFVGGEQVLAVHVGRMVQVAGSDADQMAAAASCCPVWAAKVSGCCAHCGNVHQTGSSLILMCVPARVVRALEIEVEVLGVAVPANLFFL